MNRADFMKRLTELLADVSSSEREAAIQYYNDYFDEAGEENEQSVIASLGSPEQLAQTIKAGLADGGNAGEFTEKGFSGYEQKRSDEVLDVNTPYGESDGARGNASGRAGGQEGWSGGYQNADGSYRNTSQNQKKKGMSGGVIALIVVLCILASPIIIGIGGGVLGVIVGVLGTVLGVIVSIAAVALVLLIAGICLFVCGIVLIFGTPLGALALMGVGMICAALGILAAWLTIIICGRLIPALIRGIVKLFNNLFRRGGVTA